MSTKMTYILVPNATSFVRLPAFPLSSTPRDQQNPNCISRELSSRWNVLVFRTVLQALASFLLAPPTQVEWLVMATLSAEPVRVRMTWRRARIIVARKVSLEKQDHRQYIKFPETSQSALQKHTAPLLTPSFHLFWVVLYSSHVAHSHLYSKRKADISDCTYQVMAPVALPPAMT